MAQILRGRAAPSAGTVVEPDPDARVAGQPSHRGREPEVDQGVDDHLLDLTDVARGHGAAPVPR